MARSPVFVIGSSWRGLRWIYEGVLHAGYVGHSDGMLFSLTEPLSQATNKHFEVLSKLGPAPIAAELRVNGVTDSAWYVFKEVLDRASGQAPWAEKIGSCEIIASTPTMRKLWPDCVFIFCKCRALGDIQARLDAFPWLEFAHHCNAWANSMRSWRYSRLELPADSFIEINQEDVLARPRDVAEQLGGFLALNAGQRNAFFEGITKPRSVERDRANVTAALSIGSAPWSEANKDLFQQICYGEMIAYDYVLDEFSQYEAD